MAKYLDENGLLYFWQKLKEKINAKTTMSEVEAKGYTTMSAVEAKNYTTMSAVEGKNYTTMTAVEGKGYTTMSAVEGKGYTTMSAVEGKGYQTSTQVESAISTAIAGVTQFDYEIVESLPATGVKGKVYLVPKTAATNDSYKEYIWLTTQNKFECIGETNTVNVESIPNTDIDTILTK